MTVSRDGYAQQLKDRDVKMTWTIFLVCMSYFIFVMPISLLNIVDAQVWFPASHLIAFCIYWSQYSLNCLVYAVRSDQYRKAYVFFLTMVINRIRRFMSRVFKVCFVKRKITNTTAFLYIERSVLPPPLDGVGLEKSEFKTIPRDEIFQSLPSLNHVGNGKQFDINPIIVSFTHET